MIADVIPETKTFSRIESFSYLIPPSLSSDIKTGSIVRIPLGKRLIRGVVISVKAEQETSYKLKEIAGVIQAFQISKAFLEIIDWVSRRYFCSKGEALSLFLPPEIKRPKKTPEKHEDSYPSLKKLNGAQTEIYQSLADLFDCPTKKPALLHGVTGSGKTEIYLHLTKKALENNKQVIVLVPEIMLTPQTVERFEEAFCNKTVVMHSNLSKSEKYSCYKQYYSGEKNIIIGPRSALLVPSNNTGLIIIDEEQEDSYKQEQSPRYHAVSLAEKIAEQLGSLLLLGTATPRIETYHKTQKKDYHLFQLETRHGNIPLPKATVIDLREEIKSNNFSPISKLLQETIKLVLSQNRQALLFLNRRGTATFISCRDCGYIVNCPSCSVPMVYHVEKNEHYLNCHYCNSKKPIPLSCPECHGTRIKYFGAGIEKIINEIAGLFSSAKILQVDSKSITSKHDYENFYQQIKKGEIDLVVGTQMVAKGLDMPNVDLVGIISADVGLHLPHFRASEKTFQLLVQVAGRSGRRNTAGKTVIQTYWPENQAIICAASHDFASFYQKEICERKKYNYPPFCNLTRVIAEDKEENKAKSEIARITKILKDNDITVIGPAPAFHKKLYGKYRYHLIIKSNSKSDPGIERIAKDNQQLVWDFEPTNLL